MNHDLLCPWQVSTEFDAVVSCDDCDLIAKVRADETNQIRDRHDRHSGLVCSDSYGRGLRDAMVQFNAIVAGMKAAGEH